MARELKFLYQTSVRKEIEKPVVETREENGEKVEVKKTVKSIEPIKVAIAKPDRRLFKEAEMFYAKTLSNYLKEGLLPYSLVAKRYANDGGPLSEGDKQRINELREEAAGLNQELFSMATEGKKEEEIQAKKNDIIFRMVEINTELTGIQTAFADIYDATAEVKSRNDTIEWWSLHLIYIDEDGKGYKSFFGDGTYIDRMTKLEDFEDESNPFRLEVMKKMSYLVSFWFTSQTDIKEEEYKSVEQVYTTRISKYMKDEKVPEKDGFIPQTSIELLKKSAETLPEPMVKGNIQVGE